MAGPIAYVTWFYPHLTETFVYREVLALRRRGVEVATFAAWPPDRALLTPELSALAEQTRYAFPIPWIGFFVSHLYWLVRRPLRYVGTLCFVVTRRHPSFAQRALACVHFGVAVDLARSMRGRRVRHVHAHFAINAATVGMVAARLLDVPFSFTAHNLVFSKPMMLAEKLREARFVVAISEYTRRYLVDYAAPEPIADKVHVVHCGLDADDFVPPPERAANPVPELLLVAQLVERKGVPVLVEACRLLLDRGVKLRCTVVGDGPHRGAVESRIRELALADTVALAGAQPEARVVEHLDRADVFVLPCVVTADGDVDGIPVVLMEAMAKGVPVVSTTVSGIPELVEDGRSGLLVAPGDAGALADAIQRLLEDPDLRGRIGAAGRDKVRREFDAERAAARLAALFEA